VSARRGTLILLVFALSLFLAVLVIEPRWRRRARAMRPGSAKAAATSLSLQELLARTGEEVLGRLEHRAFVGRVFDSAGAPIEGAVMYLDAEPGARTDASGSYEIPVPEEPPLASLDSFGASLSNLVAYCEGYVPVSQSVSPGGGHHSFVLYAGGDVSGLVRERDRTPIAGARVRVSVAQGPEHTTIELPPLTTETSELGHFRLRGLPPFTVEVAITKDGFAPLEFLTSFRRQWDLHLPDLVLERGASVGGHIVDDRGDAIADAVVACGDARTLADAEGSFHLEGLGAGSSPIDFSAPGFVATRVVMALQASKSTDCDVALDRECRIAGHVMMLPSSVPVSAALAIEPLDGEGGGQHSQSAQSDASGQFEIAGLAEGDYLLHALREDLSVVASQTVTLQRGAVTSADLWLADCALVKGRVLRGGTLEPVPGARLRLARVEVAADRPEPASTVSSDHAGEFVLGPCRPGVFLLEADTPWSRAESRKVVVAEGDIADETLVLSAGMRLEERMLTASGAAAKMRPVWVREAGGWRGAFTDAQGGFRITGLSARPADLVVRDPAGLDWVVPLPAEGSEVTLPARASLELTLRDARGRAVSDSYVVTLRGPGLREAPIFQVQGPGALALDGLPAGPLTVLTSAPGHREPEALAVELVPGPNRISVTLR
jgi:hypothetical protein